MKMMKITFGVMVMASIKAFLKSNEIHLDTIGMIYCI